MESFCRKSPPEPGISVKSEIEFDFESDPEYDIMENQIELDTMAEGELKAEVQDIQKTEVQVKSEPETVIWIKSEPEADVEMKHYSETGLGIKMEFEADLETQLEFGVGTKSDDSMVRIFLVYTLFFAEKLYISFNINFFFICCNNYIALYNHFFVSQ